MAIHKSVRHHNKQTADAAQPAFSYPADARLANVIVDAWLNRDYTYTPPAGPAVPFGPLRDALLDRDRNGNPTKKAFDAATARIGDALGIDLKRAVVITEVEHDNDYFKDEDEIVFVLPDASLVASLPSPVPAPPNPPRLVEAAKLLMACTPNGIKLTAISGSSCHAELRPRPAYIRPKRGPSTGNEQTRRNKRNLI